MEGRLREANSSSSSQHFSAALWKASGSLRTFPGLGSRCAMVAPEKCLQKSATLYTKNWKKEKKERETETETERQRQRGKGEFCIQVGFLESLFITRRLRLPYLNNILCDYASENKRSINRSIYLLLLWILLCWPWPWPCCWDPASCTRCISLCISSIASLSTSLGKKIAAKAVKPMITYIGFLNKVLMENKPERLSK